jgi:hypothetical protein
MIAMRKRQVLLGLCHALAMRVVAVAPAARSRVVWLGMTLQAGRGRRQIEGRIGIALRDARVTRNASDSLGSVNAVRERFLRLIAQPEHARTRGDETQTRERCAVDSPAHGNTSVL